ncbi:MAG: hypothetical protein ABIH89_01120 [Elusimicrobiota bacterium]
MKTITKILIMVTAVSVLGTGMSNARMKLAPYYNYKFIEGVSVSPTGDFGFLVNLSNDIGLIVQPVEKHTFIGFYSLKYQGPGLKEQEGREFSERYLDHMFVGRHHWTLPDGTVLKTQYDMIFEARRSGTNETWDNGLYNFNRYGGTASFSKMIGKVEITPAFKYHYMTFPNYTDMLAELRSGADASASEGKQNHHIIEVGGQAKYKENAGKLNVAQQLYTKQKVAVDTVQDDGTYYSSEGQKDLTVTISAKREQELSPISVLIPEVTFVLKDSNQNYQHFTDVTSTSPVSFHADYNDYMDISFAVPVSLGLSKKWSLIFSPSLSYKKYMKRNARAEDGSFYQDKKQTRMLSIYTLGFRNQIGESSSSMMFVTYQTQASNMEYEKYVAYNYSGYSLGLKFQLEY